MFIGKQGKQPFENSASKVIRAVSKQKPEQNASRDLLEHWQSARSWSSLKNCNSSNKLPAGEKSHFRKKGMKVVSKEVIGLCSKTNPSLVRKTGKKDLEKFD